MPRFARLDAPGVLHHVIIRGIERKAIFMDRADQENFVDRLAQLVPGTGTSCYAWALMTNHAHFLFRSGLSGLALLMRRLLTGYAFSFNSARLARLRELAFQALIRTTMVAYIDTVEIEIDAVKTPKKVQPTGRDRGLPQALR